MNEASITGSKPFMRFQPNVRRAPPPPPPPPKQWSMAPFSPSQKPRKQESTLHSIFSPSYKQQQNLFQPKLSSESFTRSPNRSHSQWSFDCSELLGGMSTPPKSQLSMMPEESPYKIPYRELVENNNRDHDGWNTSSIMPDDSAEFFFTPKIGGSPLSAISAVTEPTLVNLSLKTEAKRSPSNGKNKAQPSEINLEMEDPVGPPNTSSILRNLSSRFGAPRTASQHESKYKAPSFVSTLGKETLSPSFSASNSIFQPRSSIYSPPSLIQSKGSLDMSLSPMSVCLQGEHLVETPKGVFGSSFDFSACQKLGTIPESKFSSEKASSPTKFYLREQVQKLRMERMALEATRVADQQSFLEKLHNLEKTKVKAENTTKELQQKVSTASIRTQELIATMQQVQRESIDVRKQLDMQRKSQANKNQETVETEKRLEQTIRNLQSQLARTKGDLKHKNDNEKADLEQQVAEGSQRTEEANRLLRDARQQLQHLKQSQHHIRNRLLTTLGVSEMEIRHLMRQSESDFVQNFVCRLEKMKATNQSMVKVAQESVENIRRVQGERDDYIRRYDESENAQTRLREENNTLIQQVQELTEEVQSSRAYIDKLLQTTQEVKESEWEEREEQYKMALTNLRLQLRKENTMVSIDLYKAAMDDGRKKTQTLQIHQRTIESLRRQVAELEKDSNISQIKTPKRVAHQVRFALLSPTDCLEQGLFSERTLQQAKSPLDSCRLRFRHKSPIIDRRKHDESNTVAQKDAIVSTAPTKPTTPKISEVSTGTEKPANSLQSSRTLPFASIDDLFEENEIMDWVDQQAKVACKKKAGRPISKKREPSTTSHEKENKPTQKALHLQDENGSLQHEEAVLPATLKEKRIDDTKSVRKPLAPKNVNVPVDSNTKCLGPRKAFLERRKSGGKRLPSQYAPMPAPVVPLVNPEAGLLLWQSDDRLLTRKQDIRSNKATAPQVKAKVTKAILKTAKGGDRDSIRRAKVRSAGGRKGLQDQLLKLRSPPAKKHVHFMR